MLSLHSLSPSQSWEQYLSEHKDTPIGKVVFVRFWCADCWEAATPEEKKRVRECPISESYKQLSEMDEDKEKKEDKQQDTASSEQTENDTESTTTTLSTATAVSVKRKNAIRKRRSMLSNAGVVKTRRVRRKKAKLIS